MKHIVFIVLALLVLSGCVKIHGLDGQPMEIEKTELGLSAVETATTFTEKLLKAQVKGSIYESGETVSVFGTCLDADDGVLPGIVATMSAWYPNGTQFIFETVMAEVTPGHFLYTAPMDPVRGTYLTRLKCQVGDANSTGTGQNLVAYWDAESGGTNAVATGTALSAIGSASVRPDAKVGSFAFNLSGDTSNYWSATATELPVSGDARSLCYWGKLDADFGGSHNNFLVSWGSTPGSAGFGGYIGIPPNYAGNSYGGTGTPMSAASYTSLGTWNFYCHTYDGVTLKNYFNGVPDTTAGQTLSTTGQTIYLGEIPSVSTCCQADGAIDEVAVWSREITASEVSSIYNAGFGAPYSAVSFVNVTGQYAYAFGEWQNPYWVKRINDTQALVNVTLQEVLENQELINNLSDDVAAGFNETFVQINNTNTLINTSTTNIINNITYAAMVANDSVDRNDSYIVNLLLQIINNGTPTTGPGGAISWIEEWETPVFHRSWTINATAFVGSTQVGNDVVNCFINTTNANPTNNAQMDPIAGPKFTYTEVVKKLDDFDWDVWCVEV
jgi:hypothetical protein